MMNKKKIIQDYIEFLTKQNVINHSAMEFIKDYVDGGYNDNMLWYISTDYTVRINEIKSNLDKVSRTIERALSRSND